ncbi:MAG TPA: phosphoribosylamine--glycine ligase [Candidatus Paceibacterota bacterium]|nr:phosphoribosylamine--glycine ligase [Candidatus Paceibacterota bacterium]
MNILVIGSGGREHALAWKLKQSPRVKKVCTAPGNPGTAMLGENIPIAISDHRAVIECVRRNKIDWVIVGPDDALASGIVNSLQDAGIRVFGPTKEAAEIEWSKSFAKDLLERLDIPSAKSRTFTEIEKAKEYIQGHEYPLVIKASGLALGKGVVIAQTRVEAERVLEEMIVQRIFGAAGETVVIEEFLQGEEISIHAFCDGETAVLFPSAQDHKRIFDGDKGPNTGGMGTVAPVPTVSKDVLDHIEQDVIIPVLRELKRMGRPFKGVLFPGIILTETGPKVLEFNARFGDPETQSYMRILKTDLADILLACIDGTLSDTKIEWEDESACCVVLASKGYPGNYPEGLPIRGIPEAEGITDVVVFHAGTESVGGNLVTGGGRVLGVSATGANLDEALEKAYTAVEVVTFEGKQFRKDIA